MSAETWTEDAKLFQPFALEQTLMHENASCLAVIALLRICNLPHTVVERENAEFMATNGRLSRLPLLCMGKMVIAEFEPIARLAMAMQNPISTVNSNVERKDADAADAGTGDDDGDDEDELWIHICNVENTFTMAELHFSFMNEQIYQEITVPRMHVGFPWPLNRWRAYKKRRQCLQLLRTYQRHDSSNEDVIGQLERCCAALSERLTAAKTYFFGGAQPCALDAIVFGHIFTILTTKLPPQELLAQTVLKFTRLYTHCRQFEAQFFADKIERVNSKTRLMHL